MWLCPGSAGPIVSRAFMANLSFLHSDVLDIGMILPHDALPGVPVLKVTDGRRLCSRGLGVCVGKLRTLAQPACRTARCPVCMVTNDVAGTAGGRVHALSWPAVRTHARARRPAVCVCACGAHARMMCACARPACP